MSKFSPAPWELIEDEGSAKIIDGDGEFVTYVAQSRYHDNRDDKTADANKHLIAAAPDLYKALEAIADQVSDAVDQRIRSGKLPPVGALLSLIEDTARAALARARGEQ